MDSNRTFSKEEISKILALASKIQTRKDLNRDEQVLTVDDLQHIAKEVGIDRESLHEAILSSGSPERDAQFRWLSLSSTLLNDQTVSGELTEEAWEDVVQEIRRITGNIGKPGKVGSTFEWEDRSDDVGYEIHLSLHPQNGSTKVRYLAKWTSFELTLCGFSMIVGGGLGMFLFNFLGLSGASFFTLPFLGSLAGLGTARLYLHNYFERQKSKFTQIVAAVEKRLRRGGTKKTMLDEVELDQDTASETQRAFRERS